MIRLFLKNGMVVSYRPDKAQLTLLEFAKTEEERIQIACIHPHKPENIDRVIVDTFSIIEIL